MDLSEIWGHLLLNASTVCLRPSSNIPIIQGIQIIAPATYVAASNSELTNSSISSETSVAAQESENEIDQDEENLKINEKDEDCGNEAKDEKNDQKKSIQRIRYSKEEYRCGQCPYTCTTEKAFLRHVRTCESKHDEEDNKSDAKKAHSLSCPICGKDRRDEDSLSKHMTKHKQQKHFCCDICRFKSLQLKKLIQHRRMHTGEKPHLCPFCSYRSSRRDNLRSHVRRVHKKNNLPCDTFTPRSMVLTPTKSSSSLGCL